MSNIVNLMKLGMLGAVRQRLGAEDKDDTSYDEDILKMSNHDLVGSYCGWYLGDEGWWEKLKYKFDSLEELSKESSDE